MLDNGNVNLNINIGKMILILTDTDKFQVMRDTKKACYCQ